MCPNDMDAPGVQTTRMPPPENLKCKLLTPDADRDGRTDGRTGVTLYAFHHSSNEGGKKIQVKMAENLSGVSSLYNTSYILKQIVQNSYKPQFEKTYLLTCPPN